MIAGVFIYNLLSALVEGRVYPDEVGESDNQTTPYIVYQDISNIPEITMEGVTGHEWVRMQIDVYHHDKYAGVLLANKAIQLINDNSISAIYGGKVSSKDGALYRQMIEYEFWQTADTE